jgi:MoaA/NifB/PqqE/SkfB family radical SAM enzyme
MDLNKNSPESFPKGCFLPLNAIAVHPQGFPHFCLTSTMKHEGGLKDFEAKRMEIHEALLRGEWPTTCLRCKNKEDRNLQSRRTRTWERKAAMYGMELAKNIVENESRATIRHLEISFSNVCNISCVMCSSEFSSSWIPLDKRAVEGGIQFRDFTTPFQKIHKINKELLDEIVEHLEDIDLIIIKGGEPTREPVCLEFLKKVASSTKKKSNLSVFLQSNGTRDPKEWMVGLEDLNFEVGFSIDGWNEVFRWIRGADFERVLNHFIEIQNKNSVKSVSIDFTLSAFNCFHLPEFFEELIELKKRSPKLLEVPVFQWVQQDYASPLNLRIEDRIRIADQLEPIMKKGGDLFLNSENLLRVLRQPRANESSIEKARTWYDYLKSIRGYAMKDWDQKIVESLN